MSADIPGILWIGAACLAAIYTTVVVAAYHFQRRLLYVPDARRPSTDALAGCDVREIRITAADSLRLLAWYLPPTDASGVLVIYFHGNAGNIADRADRARRFAQAGIGVLLPEYRGYGGNPGTASEATLAQDATAVIAAATAHGFGASRIVLYGESLGTAVATRAAAESAIAALILESPFRSMVALGREHFPWLPVGWILRDRFECLSYLRKVSVPVLLMAAARDRLVNPAHAQRLHDAVTAPKQLWIAQNAGHNDLGDAGAIDVAIDFIRRHVPGEPARDNTRQANARASRGPRA